MNQKTIDDLVEWWKPRLGLTHWDISVVWGTELADYWQDAPANAHASIWRSKAYDEAKLYVNPKDYKDWSMKDANRHIVHELLHLIMREVEFVGDQADGYLNKEVAEMFDISFHHAIEGAVDRLAMRFVDLVGIR